LVHQTQNKIVNSAQLQTTIQRKESSHELAEKLKKSSEKFINRFHNLYKELENK